MSKQKKTLILSIVFSSFAPIVTGLALLLTDASTQLADFLRRTIELFVLIMALYTYNKTAQLEPTAPKRKILETRQRRLVSLVLLMTATFLSVFIVRSILDPSVPSGNVIPGLTIASFGLVFNGGFFFRYRSLHKREANTVMDAQAKLYGTKSLIDASVIIALASVLVMPGSQISYWIDLVGSFIIVVYLVVNSLMMLLGSNPSIQNR